MRKTNQIWRTLVIAALLVIAVSAVADAFALAPGWRGDAGSTYQKWAFETDANPAVLSSDPNLNPYGSPSASIQLGDFGQGWFDFLPGFGTRTGYWDLGSAGTISMELPNRPYNGGYKEMWVLVTYFSGIWPAPTVDVIAQGQHQLLDEYTFEIEPDPSGGAWTGYLTKWRIEPNPLSEQVIITADPMFGGMIDEIEIDTICVPEPASFATLLMGVPFLLALRRRKA